MQIVLKKTKQYTIQQNGKKTLTRTSCSNFFSITSVTNWFLHLQIILKNHKDLKFKQL